MIARLQAALVGAALMLALVAGLWVGHAHGVPAGAATALAVLALPAAVITLECLLAWHVNAKDEFGRADPQQWWRAWRGELACAARVFAWWQPFRSRTCHDQLPSEAVGRRGLILVHGYACNRGLWNGWLERLRLMPIATIAVNLEPAFGTIEQCTAPIDAAAARLRAHTGQAPVIVAHSMGGLAVRQWLRDLVARGDDPAHAVAHVVTLGTPHRGTWLARFGYTANGRQMRLDGEWLQALAVHEQAGAATRVPFTCWYSACDNIVFPASTATLPHACNRPLHGVAHLAMVQAEPVFQDVLRLVHSEPDGTDPCAAASGRSPAASSR